MVLGGEKMTKFEERITRNLIKAVSAGNLAKTKLWIKMGANVNGVGDGTIAQPVFLAAKSRNIQILNYLKEKGANLNVSFNGVPALFSAFEEDVKIGNFETTNFFINSGADLNVRNLVNNNFLMNAFYLKVPDVEKKVLLLKYLISTFANKKMSLSKKIDFNATGKDYSTILTLIARNAASHKQSQSRVRLLSLLFAGKLMECGANANIPDVKGRLPLYYALDMDDVLMTKTFAPYTDMSILTKDGQSLLGACFSAKTHNILVGYGAKYCGAFEDNGAWTWQMLRFNEIGTSKTFAQIEKIRNSFLYNLSKNSLSENLLTSSIKNLLQKFKALQPEQKWVDKNHERYCSYINQANNYGKRVLEQIHEISPEVNAPELRLDILLPTTTDSKNLVGEENPDEIVEIVETIEANKVDPNGDGK